MLQRHCKLLRCSQQALLLLLLLRACGSCMCSCRIL
jgi:hypothetical protein